MKTLTLSLLDQTWYVTDTDPKTLRLFGTNTLPTPYTDRTPVGWVIYEIQTLNPDAVIKVV